MLPALDDSYVSAHPGGGQVISDGGMICVVLTNFELPTGFDQPASDLLLRLSPGYPDVAPDMWWFDPPIRRTDGGIIAAADVTENHLNRAWQRWSRHLNPGQWKPGIDSLQSYVSLVRKELERAAMDIAA